MSEDQILNKIAVEQALALLNDPEREMVLRIVFEISFPDDWTEERMTYAACGRYIGNKFRDGPLSEAAIRYIRDQALEQLRGARRGMRKNRRN